MAFTSMGGRSAILDKQIELVAIKLSLTIGRMAGTGVAACPRFYLFAASSRGTPTEGSVVNVIREPRPRHTRIRPAMLQERLARRRNRLHFRLLDVVGRGLRLSGSSSSGRRWSQGDEGHVEGGTL